MAQPRGDSLIVDEDLDVLEHRQCQRRIFEALNGCCGARIAMPRMPFGDGDVTAGTESELATAVAGAVEDVDLPLALEQYITGLAEGGNRCTREDLIARVRGWLNAGTVWEYSRIRMPEEVLGTRAREMLRKDLARRDDRDDFIVWRSRERWLRLPPSYVLRLALADAVDGRTDLPEPLRAASERMLACFHNDNTSPETISLYVVAQRAVGVAVARENAARFLLTQLLTSYINDHFRLTLSGQRLLVYSAPTPATRIKTLSGMVTADAYRSLLVNPCLAGWQHGEEKKAYMHLCHEVLSRSRTHASTRQWQAGLDQPSMLQRIVCDTSLLNNGVHLSLGSRLLSREFGERPDGRFEEKYLGDLCAKIVEHFLPLFVGTYTAAPQRLGPARMRANQAMGFLPNELTSQHLGFVWQTWKRKAGVLAALKGDFIGDARLLDYFAALPSTTGAAGLDGRMGNAERVKQALQRVDLFDQRMGVYALYRLRAVGTIGFSGFEGRHYSLFERFEGDLAPAAELQQLVTALAYRYMATGAFSHPDIPDDPFTESERRQIFFAAAIGLPVFYVSRTTRNRFLLRVLARTRGVRSSRRYPTYLRVELDAYRMALHDMVVEDAAELLEMGNFRPALGELCERLTEVGGRAERRVTQGVLEELGVPNPLAVDSESFNHAAEGYYRGRLCSSQSQEALRLSGAHLDELLKHSRGEVAALGRWVMQSSVPHGDLRGLVQRLHRQLAAGRMVDQDRMAMIHLLVWLVECETLSNATNDTDRNRDVDVTTPVYSTRHR